uniref:Ribonuclease VapC n=1 Tax=Candidatus Kentrum sp. FW TaxID=2126338 RepID=A0A450RZA0_9GAMM|nr:MAG: ribonuclease VapC [Candidatus Kentron sp. FW]
MIIDSSAFLAILLGEAEQEDICLLIEEDTKSIMSVASYLEISIKIHNMHDAELISVIDKILNELGITLMLVSVEQALIAREAHKKFGKGMGHPARLNFGDCFSYALAKEMDLPLLFKGDDFIYTDLKLIRAE